MEIKKIKRGERLQIVLTGLGIGEAVKVPYRHYSENSIRATASQLKSEGAYEFNVNARSSTAAVITRIR